MPIFLSFIQLLLLLTVFRFETPKFYKDRSMWKELNTLMCKLYDADRVQERINAIPVMEVNTSAPSYKEVMTSPRYKMATYVGCTIALLNQLVGINAINFYSGTIFAKAGIDGKVAGVGVGAADMLGALSAVLVLRSKKY